MKRCNNFVEKGKRSAGCASNRWLSSVGALSGKFDFADKSKTEEL